MRRYQDMSTKRLKQHRATIDGILAVRGNDGPTPPDRAEPERYDGASRWIIVQAIGARFAIVTGIDRDVHEPGMDNILVTFVEPPDYEARHGCQSGAFTRGFLDRYAYAWDSSTARGLRMDVEKAP